LEVAHQLGCKHHKSPIDFYSSVKTLIHKIVYNLINQEKKLLALLLQANCSTLQTYKNIIASPKGVLENSLWASSKKTPTINFFCDKIRLNTEKCTRGLDHTIG